MEYSDNNGSNNKIVRSNQSSNTNINPLTTRLQILIITKESSLNPPPINTVDPNSPNYQKTRPLIDNNQNLKTLLRILETLRWKYYVYSTSNNKLSGFPALIEKNNKNKGRFSFVIYDSVESYRDLKSKFVSELENFRESFGIGRLIFGLSESDDLLDRLDPDSEAAENNNNNTTITVDTNTDVTKMKTQNHTIFKISKIENQNDIYNSNQHLLISSVPLYDKQILKLGVQVHQQVPSSQPFYNEFEEKNKPGDDGWEVSLKRIGFQPFYIIGSDFSYLG